MNIFEVFCLSVPGTGCIISPSYSFLFVHPVLKTVVDLLVEAKPSKKKILYERFNYLHHGLTFNGGAARVLRA